VNPQQVRYSLDRSPTEPAFRRDRKVLHMFFRGGDAIEASLVVYSNARDTRKPLWTGISSACLFMAVYPRILDMNWTRRDFRLG
jgi:hypothetical protein